MANHTRRSRRFAALIVAIAALALFASPAAAERNSADRMGGQYFDAFILRPLNFARLLIGAPVMILYPLTLGSSQSSDMLERLITEPWEATFQKDLGDF